MLPIQNFYTGQQAGTVIPELGKTEAAVTRAYEKEQRLSELKYQDALRRRSELLDASEVDPIDIIADKMQEEQAMKIESFQKMVEDSYTKYKGDLPTDELLKLQRARRDIQGWQKRQLATQEKFLKDEATFRSRPGYFDKESWDRARATMYEKGEYDPAGLQIRSIDADGDFRKFMQSKEAAVKQKNIERTTTVGGVTDKATFVGYEATDEQIKENSTNRTLANEQVMVTRAREYAKLSDNQKGKYDRMAEEDPAFLGNPILAYAYERNRIAFEPLMETKEGDVLRKTDTTKGVWTPYGFQIGGKIVTSTMGNLGQSPQFLKDKEGVAVYTGEFGGKTVSLSKDVIEEVSNQFKVAQMQGSIRAVPAFISQDGVEWEVFNKDKLVKMYDLDDTGGVKKYSPRELLESKRRLLMSEPNTDIEKHGDGANVYYVVVRTPERFYVKTPLYGVEKSLESMGFGELVKSFPEKQIDVPFKKKSYIDIIGKGR